MRSIVQKKNAAAPYWGDGGRGSTQFRRMRTPGALELADNGAGRAALVGWADVLSALGGKPWVRLNRSDGRSRGVFVACVCGGRSQPLAIRSLARVWRLLVPVDALDI